MTDSQRLLADYIQAGSETAFRELVTRYVDLVYSTALRLVNGDTHRAEDVAQMVFVDLTHSARTLSPDVMLGGWLHRHTCFVAAKTMRGERRRQTRERHAVEMHALQNDAGSDFKHLAPLLDEAINELGDADRTAILLRFFEQHDFRSVGEALGSNEDAARMRVNRALEKLQELLKRRGLTSSAAALSVVLSAHAVSAAPVGLALTVFATTAFAGTTLATTTITTQTTMNWITVKSISAIVAAAIAAGTGTYLVQQHTAKQLRAENQRLAATQQAITKERDAALGAVAVNAEELKRRESDKAELMRLRGEVGQLQRQAKASGDLAAQNRQLQEAVNALAQKAGPPAAEPEVDPEKSFQIERINQSKQLVLGLLMYAADNEEMLPTDLNSISNYLGNAASELIENHPFELVLQGNLTNVPNPSMTIALRSKSPFVRAGKAAKAYAFADGHSEVKPEPEEGFEAWEKQRMIPAPAR